MTTTAGIAAVFAQQLSSLLDAHLPVSDQRSAVDRIQLVGQVMGMLESDQAAVAVEFRELRLAQETADGVPVAKRGKGVHAELALARRESPARGKQFLETALALAEDLPHTQAALDAGRIREAEAQLLTKETAELSAAHRREVDAAMADRLGTAGRKELANEARAHALRLDPGHAKARHTKGVEERRVTCEPIGFGLSKLTAIGPSQQLEGVYQNLWQSARSDLSTGNTKDSDGNRRNRGNIMFDTLVARATGQASAITVPVQVLLAMRPETLFAHGTDPAWLVGHGPIPACVARDWLADPDVAVELRRIFTDPAGHELVGLESRSRKFPAGLRQMILLRDDWCRTPYCEAHFQDADHMESHRQGGKTSFDNASGLCGACNQTKECRGWSHHGDARQLTVTTPTGQQHSKPPGPLIPGATPAVSCPYRAKKPAEEPADDPDDATDDDAPPAEHPESAA